LQITADLFTKRTSGSFRSLNGLRTLSCCYIIFGHAYLIFGVSSQPSNIVPALQSFGTSWDAILVVGAFAAVDTFFFISGFLGAYTMLRKIDVRTALNVRRLLPTRTASTTGIAQHGSQAGGGGEHNLTFARYWLLVLHRYLRLTPLYAVVLLWWMKMLPYLADGPTYQQSVWDATAFCEGHWHENLMYVNNVVPFGGPNTGAGSCMGWSWYLANDFQFFLATPPLLALYLWRRDAGRTVMAVLVVGCVVANGVISHQYGADILTLSPAYAEHIYAKPYTRISPYVIGLMLGCHFHERRLEGQGRGGGSRPSKRGTKTSSSSSSSSQETKPLTLAWAVVYAGSVALMVLFDFLLVWDNYRSVDGGVFGAGRWPQSAKNVFNALQRTLFSVGLAGFSHMLFTGHGGPVRAFLQHRVFDILAKLTYGAYLWSLFIMTVKAGSKLEFPAFSSVDTLWDTFACTVLGFLVAFITYVVVESPMGTLQDWLMAALTSRQGRA
jgi:peptidoglycan/LPS O-acetylase OafA/YrhL